MNGSSACARRSDVISSTEHPIPPTERPIPNKLKTFWCTEDLFSRSPWPVESIASDSRALERVREALTPKP
jgi:hypothetical protein